MQTYEMKEKADAHHLRVSRLGNSVFENCTALTVLSDGISMIASYIFEGCFGFKACMSFSKKTYY